MSPDRYPDQIERSLPIVVGAITVAIAGVSLLRGGQLGPPDLLSIFMAISGLFAVMVSVRPESRRVRSVAGALVVASYIVRAADYVWSALRDHHPQTAFYWYGISLGILIYILLAYLVWVVWTRVVVPWGETLYLYRLRAEKTGRVP